MPVLDVEGRHLQLEVEGNMFARGKMVRCQHDVLGNILAEEDVLKLQRCA